MAARPSNAVAKAATAGAIVASEAVPDFMKKYVGQGTENLGAADVEVPRIKLLQGLSPECEEHENAKPGIFWHSMANVPLGKDVLIIPVYIDQRAILWRPREDGGGILARADDGRTWSPPNGEFRVNLGKKPNTKEVVWRTRPSVAASGLLEWGSSDPSDPASQPAATKMYNMVVICPEHPDLPPAVVTMQRAGIKPARKFLGKLKMARAPSYGMLFRMTSKVDSNSNAEKFQNFDFVPSGFVSDPKLFETAQDLYESFKRIGLRVADEDGLQTEAATMGADTGGGDEDTSNAKY